MMALNIAVPLTTVGDLMEGFGLLSPISPLSVDCRSVSATGTHGKQQLVSPVGSESSGVSSLDSDEIKLTSRLLYGLELTSRSTSALVRVLDPVYNTMIRHASGLLPGTPAPAACAEAGCLPFDAVVARAAISKGISFLERTAGADSNNSSSTRRTIAELLAQHTITTTQQQQQELPPVAKLHYTGDRAWYAAPPRVDWTLKATLGSRGTTNTLVVGRHFAQLTHTAYNTDRYVHYYTDGSKKQTPIFRLKTPVKIETNSFMKSANMDAADEDETVEATVFN